MRSAVNVLRKICSSIRSEAARRIQVCPFVGQWIWSKAVSSSVTHNYRLDVLQYSFFAHYRLGSFHLLKFSPSVGCCLVVEKNFSSPCVVIIASNLYTQFSAVFGCSCGGAKFCSSKCLATMEIQQSGLDIVPSQRLCDILWEGNIDAEIHSLSIVLDAKSRSYRQWWL